MPDYPPEALDAAIAALRERSAVGPGSDLEKAARWHAKVALDAAAPVLAEAVAQKILAHMNARIANPAEVRLSRAAAVRNHMARMHFSTAARIAAGAFDTREDQLRMAAEAIGRGDFIACDIPEVPGEH